MKPRHQSSLFAVTSALAAISFSQIQAADATWNGTTDAIWATASNWSGPPAAVPGTGNVATFNNSGNGNTTIDLGAGVVVGGLSFDTANAAAYSLGTDTIQTLQLDDTSSVTVGAGVVADQTITARINLGTTANATQIFNFSNASTDADLILGELVRRATTSTNQRRNAEVNVSGDGDVVMGQLRLEGDNATGVMKLFKSGAGTLTLGQGAGDVDNRFTNLESLTAGTVVLNKASSATVHALGGGTHIINGGTLQLAGTGGDQIFDNSSVNVTVGGVFDLNGRSETINNLLGDATGNIRNTANSTTSTLTIGANAGSGDFAGVVADNAGGGHTGIVALTKIGNGTLTLAGTNTYTGTTAVNAGTLAVNGDQSAATGTLNVSGTGSRLVGLGTVGGHTTVNSGAIHSAGATANAAGIQTFSGTSGGTNLSYSAGSIFEWDINGNTNLQNESSPVFDQIQGTGILSVDSAAIFKVILGSAVNLTDAFWSTPGTTRTWTNIFSGFTAVTGGFDPGMLQVSGPSLDGIGSFSVSGTSLTWSAVPEPSSALAALLLAGGLMRRFRSQEGT